MKIKMCVCASNLCKLETSLKSSGEYFGFFGDVTDGKTQLINTTAHLTDRILTCLGSTKPSTTLLDGDTATAAPPSLFEVITDWLVLQDAVKKGPNKIFI